MSDDQRMEVHSRFSRRSFLFRLAAVAAVPVVAKVVSLPLVQRALDAIPEPLKQVASTTNMSDIWADLKEYYQGKQVEHVIYRERPFLSMINGGRS